MIFAKCKDCATKTELRLLRDTLETLVRNLRSEWETYYASIEDVHEKIDHITKRSRKRTQREAVKEPDPEPYPQLDLVSQRVLERRNNGIRRISG